MAERKFVRAEKESGRTVAIVYGGGIWGEKLAERLRKEDLRVIFVDPKIDLFPVLEKPRYIFFFATDTFVEESWKEAVVTAKRNEAVLVLGLADASVETEVVLLEDAQRVDWSVKLVEIRGGWEKTSSELIEATEKIIKLAFSSDKHSGKLLLTGKVERQTGGRRRSTSDTASRVMNLIEEWQLEKKRRRRVPWYLTVASVLVLLFFSPLLVATGLAGWGGWQLRASERMLFGGNFSQAKKEALSSGGKFELAAGIVSMWSPIWNSLGLGQVVGKYYGGLLVGARSGSALSHTVGLAEEARNLTKGILDGEVSGQKMLSAVSEMKTELTAIDFDLGLIEAQWPEISSLVAVFGGATDVSKKLPEMRAVVGRANLFLGVLPEVVGLGGEQKRTYLVVFQNSTELRPTGGFIGSYGVISFDQGRMLDFKINDIYSADGQLRGRIAPPDEILHFLGQPSWYMRDANWAADWPLTAQRLEWFLEKETGEKVDGVLALTLPAVQKLLAATGPLRLTAINETVSAADFYQKAEYTSEINFFPGSTQKKDFIGATAQALLEKITGNGEKDWMGIGQALGQALLEKDLMVFFNDENVQQVVEAAGWGGSIVANGCGELRANCLMVVDANLGANKANYFLTRTIGVKVTVGKAGEMENNVTVSYQNNSPNTSWPGGVYKNYVRFLVPRDAEMTGFDLGDNRRPKISNILTAEVLAATTSDQFLVFKNLELSARSVNATGSALLSFGTYFEVPVGETRTITFSYRPGQRIDFGLKEPTLRMVIFKQPGIKEDPLGLAIDYPSFLEPAIFGKEGFVALPQELRYNSDLSVDREIDVRFKKL